MSAPAIEVSFLQELAKNTYDPISKPEEKKLILMYQRDSDLSALQKLVQHNLRFIVKHVMGSANIGMDAIQAAVLGFKRAVKKFDTKKRKSGNGEGYKLITYAKRWIKYEIQEYERKIGVVAPSHYARYNGIAIEKIMGSICQYTDADTEVETGLTQRRINTAHRALKKTLPFSTEDGDGDDTGLSLRVKSDCMCPHEEAVRNEESELIHGVLKLLPDEESLVIKKRYLEDGLSYRQLSAVMNCSHETVRKLEQRGLDRLNAILC